MVGSEKFNKTLKEEAKKQGIDNEYKEYSAYTEPNPALDAGDIDMNRFQHIAYLYEHFAAAVVCCQRHGIAIHINRFFFKADVASRIGISATQNRVIHFERAITKFGFTVDFNQFYQVVGSAFIRLTAAIAWINKRSQPNVGKKPRTSGADLP